MKKKRIFYSYVGKSTFIQKDLAIFNSVYEVIEFNFQSSTKSGTIFLFIKQFYKLLFYGIKSDLFVSHFSGYHSLLPGLFGIFFRKKILIISGGTDCHSFPSIGYGNFQKSILKWFTIWSYRFCDHISPKHNSLWECVYTYDKHDFPRQGIHAFMPYLNKKYTSIPNGFDSTLYSRCTEKKMKTFLTIAGNLHYPFQMQLKGIDLILDIAPSLPDYTFTIVGKPVVNNSFYIPPNVIFKDPIPTSDLILEYSRSEYYLQLSMAEGFPNSLCEAMLCECIPIGSNVFSIPEIIGDNGFVLQHRNKTELESLLKQVCTTSNREMGIHARVHVEVNYPLTRRKTELLQLCDEIINH